MSDERRKGGYIPEAMLHKVNGGHIQPSPIDDDSIVVQLSPGAYSLDGGETWFEEER